MRSVPVAACAAFCVLLSAACAFADADYAGRWEGEIAVPGAPQPLVLDLAREPSGDWVGSVVLPGRRVKGAPLADIAVGDSGIRVGIGAAMPYPVDSEPVISARRDAAGHLRGEMQFAGLTAPVDLRRSGPPQVDRPPGSSPVDRALEGSWSGRYELFGSPREVSLVLDGKSATMTIVGRRTTEVKFAVVRQRGAALALSGNSYDIAFEGRWDAADARIDGTFLQGPIELPLVLRRGQGD